MRLPKKLMRSLLFLVMLCLPLSGLPFAEAQTPQPSGLLRLEIQDNAQRQSWSTRACRCTRACSPTTAAKYFSCRPRRPLTLLGYLP